MPGPAPPLFRVKICGITSLADAEAAIAAGADAIGLNFYPKSPRFVEPTLAQKIADATAGRVLRIGVFVNADKRELDRIARELALDAIQLHGDEPTADHQFLAKWPLIRALRIDAASVAAGAAFLAELQAAGVNLTSVLVDARHEGAYGGTGRTVDWGAAIALRERLANVPIVLAGGLTTDNVAAAIRAVRPSGVDTASGVESSPGVKDSKKMVDFVAAASSALAELCP